MAVACMRCGQGGGSGLAAEIRAAVVEATARRQPWRGGGGGHGVAPKATGVLVLPPPSRSGGRIRSSSARRPYFLPL